MKIPKNPVCPKCHKKFVMFDNEKQVYHCQSCNQEWHKDLYVLVEFPDDTSYFQKQDIGYPSFESEDNSACYITEYDYIHHFQKNPEPKRFFSPVQWPEAQQYLGEDADQKKDSILFLNELINDEKGLQDFGPSAVWVPLCNLNENTL